MGGGKAYGWVPLFLLIAITVIITCFLSWFNSLLLETSLGLSFPKRGGLL